MQSSMQFPALENFLSAYFHQDWAAEHGTPGAVADYFAAHESEDQVAQVRDELARLSAMALDETQLADLFRTLGSEYDPGVDGGTHAGWLAALKARFEAG